MAVASVLPLPLAGETDVAPALPTCCPGTGCCFIRQSTESGQTVDQSADIEVDQQAHANSRQLQVRQQLRLMDRSDGVDAFELACFPSSRMARCRGSYEPQRTLRTLRRTHKFRLRSAFLASAFSAFSVVHINVVGKPQRDEEAAMAPARRVPNWPPYVHVSMRGDFVMEVPG